MSTSTLLFVLVVLAVCSLVSGQTTGTGGGTCYEEKVVYACPTYNYTRYGSGDKAYEERTYDFNTWAIESSNISIIVSAAPQPIEGLIATYPPLDAYFNGANDANLTITRNAAPVTVAVIPLGTAFGYGGIFFLPPLAKYPPPQPTNSSVVVIGGSAEGHLTVYSQSFSLNTIPSDADITTAAFNFAQQLTNDGAQFQNITLVSFYDAIDATGNWSFTHSQTAETT